MHETTSSSTDLSISSSLFLRLTEKPTLTFMDQDFDNEAPKFPNIELSYPKVAAKKQTVNFKIYVPYGIFQILNIDYSSCKSVHNLIETALISTFMISTHLLPIFFVHIWF